MGSENQNKNLKSLLKNTKYFSEDFPDKENFIDFRHGSRSK